MNRSEPSKQLGTQIGQTVIRDFERRVDAAAQAPQQGRRRRKRGGKRTLREAA